MRSWTTLPGPWACLPRVQACHESNREAQDCERTRNACAQCQAGHDIMGPGVTWGRLGPASLPCDAWKGSCGHPCLNDRCRRRLADPERPFKTSARTPAKLTIHMTTPLADLRAICKTHGRPSLGASHSQPSHTNTQLPSSLYYTTTHARAPTYLLYSHTHTTHMHAHDITYTHIHP